MEYTLSIGCGAAMPLESAAMLCRSDGPSGYDRVIEYFLQTRAAFTINNEDVRFEDALRVADEDGFVEAFQRVYPRSFVEQIASGLDPPLVAIDKNPDSVTLARYVTRDLGLGIDLHHTTFAQDFPGGSWRSLIEHYGPPSMVIGSYSFFVCHAPLMDVRDAKREWARSERAKDCFLFALVDVQDHIFSFIEHPYEVALATKCPSLLARTDAESVNPKEVWRLVPPEEFDRRRPDYERSLAGWFSALAGRAAEVEIQYEPTVTCAAALVSITLPRRLPDGGAEPAV